LLVGGEVMALYRVFEGRELWGVWGVEASVAGPPFK